MRRPRVPNFTAAGWCYIAILAFILAGALIRQINLLLALFSLMAGLPLLNWWLVRATLRGLHVRRVVPRHVAAGDLLMVEIEASNRRRRLDSWAVTVEDEIVRDGAATGESPIAARTLFSYLPARAVGKQSYRGRIYRRGRYQFGRLRLATSFPFGLVSAAQSSEHAQTLMVFPRLGRLTPRWQRLQQSSDLGTSNVQRRQGLLEGDFYGLRDWRPGDSRRWIHWRTSARRQTPVVRQFEQQRNQDLAVIVELWQPRSPTSQQAQQVEVAVSFAASIVSDLCRRGGRTLWVAVAARQSSSHNGPTSLALTREVMESLAVAEATDSDPLPDLLSTTLEVVRPGTNAILISTRPIDLNNTERFAKLWRNPRQRAWLSRLTCIDVTRPELADYFVCS